MPTILIKFEGLLGPYDILQCTFTKYFLHETELKWTIDAYQIASISVTMSLCFIVGEEFTSSQLVAVKITFIHFSTQILVFNEIYIIKTDYYCVNNHF